MYSRNMVVSQNQGYLFGAPMLRITVNEVYIGVSCLWKLSHLWVKVSGYQSMGSEISLLGTHDIPPKKQAANSPCIRNPMKLRS